MRFSLELIPLGITEMATPQLFHAIPTEGETTHGDCLREMIRFTNSIPPEERAPEKSSIPSEVLLKGPQKGVLGVFFSMRGLSKFT